MKKVRARLDIEVFVNCPTCKALLNLMDEGDTNGVYHDECGDIISQAFPKGDWSEPHEKFTIEEVTCSGCETTFDVKGLDW